VPVWAQEGEPPSPIADAASTAGFLLLLPLGLILFTSSTLPHAKKIAPQAATNAFVVWGVAALAYLGAGFAFQFGGLAVSNPHPDFAELYWNWSPLDPTFGPGWGFIGLRGWALLGPAAKPGVYDLFLRHLALLGVVTTIPTFILYQRVRGWLLLVFGLLAGTLIYPLAGNWVWSGGWLANLGINQNLGHGFVDAGLAMPFVITGVISLAALVIFRRVEEMPLSSTEVDEFVEVPMPTAHLPLLSFFGLGMILWSWAFIANVQHIPTAVDIAMPRAALNGILGAFAGAVAAALYSRFTTAEFNSLMSARGGLAGLVLVSATAPFIPPWQAAMVGFVAGLLLPLLIYFVDHRLRLNDYTAGVTTLGVMGILGWLLIALAADGSSGVGWNKVGQASYLGVSGQGVSGLFVAYGYASDWPGQLNAQLLGAVSIVIWTLLLSGGLFKFGDWLAQRQEAKLVETVGEALAEQVDAEMIGEDSASVTSSS
jgi:Amt family ammonium transporter